MSPFQFAVSAVISRELTSVELFQNSTLSSLRLESSTFSIWLRLRYLGLGPSLQSCELTPAPGLLVFHGHPRQESNPHQPGRSRSLCPLSYEGMETQVGIEPTSTGLQPAFRASELGQDSPPGDIIIGSSLPLAITVLMPCAISPDICTISC